MIRIRLLGRQSQFSFILYDLSNCSYWKKQRAGLREPAALEVASGHAALQETYLGAYRSDGPENFSVNWSAFARPEECGSEFSKELSGTWLRDGDFSGRFFR